MTVEERLLVYSLEHQRPIRMIWEENGRLVQSTVQVETITDDSVTGTAVRPKRPVVIRKADILATDFRKSDVDLV